MHSDIVCPSLKTVSYQGIPNCDVLLEGMMKYNGDGDVLVLFICKFPWREK
jgi:hypothetical protein